MKTLILSAFALFLFNSCSSPDKAVTAKLENASCPLAQGKQAPKYLWSTSDSMSGPESVVYDAKTKSFYVSNVAGSPLGKDGKGWISKVHKSGKMTDARWVTGLNAPKGMNIRNGYLWLSDIDEVKSIQIARKKISSVIKVPNSKFLNDVVVSKTNSNIYVSDMFTDKIHTIGKSPTNETFINSKKLENPNGLVMSNGELLVASWGPGLKDDFSTELPGSILSINEKSKDITQWANVRLGNLDGIEMIDDHTAIVSDWRAGKVFKISKSGECVTLLEGFKGSADLTYLPKERMIVIPLMLENRIVAYKL